MSDKAIKYRCEDAITAYLSQFDDAGEDFDGLNIAAGHAETWPGVPALIIQAESASLFEDMPSDTGVRTVRINALLQVDYDNDENAASATRAQVDTWMGCVSYLLDDLAALQTFANYSGDPDTRTVTGFHIYDIEETDNGSNFGGSGSWKDELSFDVVCGGHDGPV